MNIGLTYNLRRAYLDLGFDQDEVAEFDSPETVDAIEAALRSLGHSTERIGALENLVQALSMGRRWDMVFNIAEGLNGFGREAQIPALLEGYGIACTFSDSLAMCLTLHKAMAKRVVRDAGLVTPDFALVATLDQVETVDLPMPLFAKPVAEGTSKGIGPGSKITNRSDLARACTELITRHRQPVLVETYLPGREFTVGILGQGDCARAVGVLEVELLPGAECADYTYATKENCEEMVRYRLVDDEQAAKAREAALAAWRVLGCRDAGRVDIRMDDCSRPGFIEANPLPGMHPTHSDLPILCTLADIQYLDLISFIVDQTAQRARTARGRGRRAA